MPTTLTRSINNPSFDEHLHSLRKQGTDIKKHNDCGDCKICRYNHLFVLGCRPNDTSSSSEMCSIPMKKKLSPADRVLRLMTIFLWIPAFALLLPQGIVSGKAVPALGILPMTISFFSGCIHIFGGAKSRGGNIIVDLFTSILHISILIPSWIVMAENPCGDWWCNGSNMALLGAYGTCPMMVVFCIHSYLVLREINWRKLNCFARDEEDDMCPHCQGDISKQTMKSKKAERKQFKSVTLDDAADRPPKQKQMEEYREDEVEAESAGRPSTDDETARLV